MSTVAIPQPEQKQPNGGVESGTTGGQPPDPPPRPDLTHLRHSLRHRSEIWGAALVVLAGLAVFYTLYVARAFFLPIVLALLFSLLLKPAVRTLSRLHVPEVISAMVIVLAFLGLTTWTIVRLTGPATTWLAPENVRRLEARVREVLRPAEKLTRASQAVEKMTAPEGADAPQRVELRKPSLADTFLGYTRSFVVGYLEMLVVLFFFLASGDHFIRKMTKVLPRLREKKEAVDIIREIESQISRYLGTVVLINLGEGTAVGLTMWVLGMPNPVLWGVLAGVANFVPYLGALATATVLGVVGLLTFDSLGHALLPVACYVTINFAEGNFISPMILGKTLTLNAGSVFLALMLWGFLWGIPGFLLAVPILMAVTILCSRIQALAPISEFFRD